MSTGIIILAAGESARMGRPKQLLKYRGKSLLLHAVETAFDLRVVPVVVLGADAAVIRPQLDEHPVLIAGNSAWREGMGASIRTGLSVLLGAVPKTSAVIFMLCDQPLVSPALLEALIATHQDTGRAIVASEYNGTLGVPALFDRSLFPELLALHGTVGARHIIEAHREQAIGVPFPDGAIDIDTPADYSRLHPSSIPSLV